MEGWIFCIAFYKLGTYIFFADRESSAATVVSDTPDSGEVEEVIADYESIYADEGEGEQEGGEEEQEGEEGEKEGEEEAVQENEEDEEDVSMSVLEKLLLDDDEQSKDDDSRAEEETETSESSSLAEKGMVVEQQQHQQQPLQNEQQQRQDQQEQLQQQQEQLQQQQQGHQQQLKQEQQQLEQEQQQQVEQQQLLEQQQQQHHVEKREAAEEEAIPPVRLNPRHHLRQAPDAAADLADPSGNTADKVTAGERAQGIPVEKSNMDGDSDISEAADSDASAQESLMAESVGTGTAQSESSKATQTVLPDISRTDAADNGQTESADVAETEADNIEQTEPADATQAVIAETPAAESVKVAETEIDNSSETKSAEAELVELVTETESADDTATTVEPPTDVSHSGSIGSDGENTDKAGSVEIEVVNGEIVQNALEDNVQNVLESVGEDENIDKQPSYHKELKDQRETHPEVPSETAKTEGLQASVEASSNSEELSTIDPSLSESVQEETSTTEAPLIEKSTGFLGSLFGGFSSDPPAPTNKEQMDPLAEERTFAEGAWSLCCWCCGLRCFFRHPASLWVHANTT